MILASLLLSAANAQEAATGFDAHGFVLRAHDGDPRDPLTLDRPGAFEAGDFWFVGLAEYADRPLVRVIAPTFGDAPPVEEVALDRLLGINANAGVAVHDRVRIDVAAPFYFLSMGPEGYQDPALGDVRAAAMVAIVRPPHVRGAGGPGLGISGHLDLPTGDPALFLGQPGVAGGVAVSGTYEGPWYTFTGEIGSQFNPEADVGNLVNADQFVSALALNVLPSETVGITAEAHLALPFTPNEVAGTAMPAEAILSLNHRGPKGTIFTVGGAAGLSQGASAARYRAFLGVGYGRVKPPREPDRDALADLVVKDRCPDGLETVNGWRDEDGCPDQLGGLAVRVTFHGEDVEDAQLTVTGPAGTTTGPSSARPSFTAIPGSAFSARAEVPARCLAGDGTATAGESTSELVVELRQRLDTRAEVAVFDPTGAPFPGATVRWSSATPTCLPEGPSGVAAAPHVAVTPMGPGRHHLVVEAEGFKVFEQDVDVPLDGARVDVVLQPSRVVLEKTKIVILDKVYFEFNKAVIKPESFALLDDVAGVINAHGDLGRVQVEGHTDDKGKDAYNLKLSQDRADSVRAYLIGKGVPPERLVAAGFGETKPIAPNDTEDGRGQNRRVEFNLIDQVDEPAPGAAP